MAKKIALFVADLYDDNELYYPYYRLQEAGHSVDLIGALKGHVYKSKHGAPAKTTHSIDEVQVEDYDALVIPGGFSPDYMRRSKAMVEFAKAIDQAQKPIAAICHGPWLMISSCDLKGKTLTCYHSIKDDLINAGATYVDQDVAVDGHYVTSRTPLDLPVFMKALLKLLG